MFATVDAKNYARKCGKLLCVKQTLGEQVQAYMTGEGITVTEMAARVGTSRQNISNVLDGAQRPKCLPDLARVMKTSVDALMAGKYVYGKLPTEGPLRVEEPTPSWPFKRLAPEEWERLGDLRHVVEDAAVTKARQLLQELDAVAPPGKNRKGRP